MAVHDDYGKQVLRLAAGDAFQSVGYSVEVDYGSEAPARIDGTVGDIGVEIESRVSKQVRGAILDLISHRSTRKLLVLLPAAHVHNPLDTAKQATNILEWHVPGRFAVVLLSGHGYEPRYETDVETVRVALGQLQESALA